MTDVAQTSSVWTVDVLTLFPDMFPGPLAHSLAELQGQVDRFDHGVWRLNAVDIRSFARDKHRVVDDAPFGGGPGMVMRPDVVDEAIASVVAARNDRASIVFLSPRGTPLNQARIRALADGPGAIVLCGRFEGIDERVVEAWSMEEISLGDFVLSGGEPAAIALIDGCVRLLPGVMGGEGSDAEESFEGGLLEYPHYTRPRVWRDREVPEVLISGHHEKVRAWRLDQAERITRERRPDLWTRYAAQASGIKR